MTGPSPGTQAARITRAVTGALAAELGVPPSAVDPDTVFTDLGLDSTGVIIVAAEIADRLGAEVPPELLFDHPTARWLAEHLTLAGA
jgi:acyl carrier protein